MYAVTRCWQSSVYKKGALAVECWSEIDMRVNLFCGFFAFGIACSSGAFAAPVITEGKAHQEVLAVALQRLNHSANPNRSNAKVRLDHVDPASFFFAAHATRPCQPSQDVCSSLLGHFRVDRHTGAVFDEDVEPASLVLR